MKLKLLVAAVLLAAVSMGAQAQQQPASKATKADAEKVVKLISGDKAKVAIYCEIIKLGDQIDEAEEKKDSKKAEALSDQMDQLGEKLGPEYMALMEGLDGLDPESKEAEEINATLEPLDKLCEK